MSTTLSHIFTNFKTLFAGVNSPEDYRRVDLAKMRADELNRLDVEISATEWEMAACDEAIQETCEHGHCTYLSNQSRKLIKRHSELCKRRDELRGQV